MDSMTKEELENPDILNANRIDRISVGSGLEIKEIRALIKQYRQSKKMMKMFKGETFYFPGFRANVYICAN